MLTINNRDVSNFKKARTSMRLACVALVLSVGSLSAISASAVGASAEANAQYRAERAVCNSGQSNQDRATCLKEAGAALAEAKRGGLTSAGGAYQQNASTRCDALPMQERDACQRRMDGQGTTTGSVQSGGVLREIVTPGK